MRANDEGEEMSGGGMHREHGVGHAWEEDVAKEGVCYGLMKGFSRTDDEARTREEATNRVGWNERRRG